MRSLKVLEPFEFITKCRMQNASLTPCCTNGFAKKQEHQVKKLWRKKSMSMNTMCGQCLIQVQASRWFRYLLKQAQPRIVFLDEGRVRKCHNHVHFPWAPLKNKWVLGNMGSGRRFLFLLAKREFPACYLSKKIIWFASVKHVTVDPGLVSSGIFSLVSFTLVGKCWQMDNKCTWRRTEIDLISQHICQLTCGISEQRLCRLLNPGERPGIPCATSVLIPPYTDEIMHVLNSKRRPFSACQCWLHLLVPLEARWVIQQLLFLSRRSGQCSEHKQDATKLTENLEKRLLRRTNRNQLAGFDCPDSLRNGVSNIKENRWIGKPDHRKKNVQGRTVCANREKTSCSPGGASGRSDSNSRFEDVQCFRAWALVRRSLSWSCFHEQAAQRGTPYEIALGRKHAGKLLAFGMVSGDNFLALRQPAEKQGTSGSKWSNPNKQ